MSEERPNHLAPNGHRWAATPPDGRLQYLSGLVDGMQYASIKLRAAISVDLMIGGLPVGVDGAKIYEWAEKFKSGIGLEPHVQNVSLGALSDALTEIYKDVTNREILIATAVPVAASIARSDSDEQISEQLERLRRKGN